LTYWQAPQTSPTARVTFENPDFANVTLVHYADASPASSRRATSQPLERMSALGGGDWPPAALRTRLHSDLAGEPCAPE